MGGCQIAYSYTRPPNGVALRAANLEHMYQTVFGHTSKRFGSRARCVLCAASALRFIYDGNLYVLVCMCTYDITYV